MGTLKLVSLAYECICEGVVHTHMHSYTCVHTEKLKDINYLLKQGPSMNSELTWLAQVDSLSRALTISVSRVLGLQVATTPAWLFTWELGTQTAILTLVWTKTLFTEAFPQCLSWAS